MALGVDPCRCPARVGLFVEDHAINKVGDALAEGDSVYETDDDLVLVGNALPFGLKLTESLLARVAQPPRTTPDGGSRICPLLIRIRGLRRIGRSRRGLDPGSGALEHEHAACTCGLSSTQSEVSSVRILVSARRSSSSRARRYDVSRQRLEPTTSGSCTGPPRRSASPSRCRPETPRCLHGSPRLTRCSTVRSRLTKPGQRRSA